MGGGPSFGSGDSQPAVAVESSDGPTTPPGPGSAATAGRPGHPRDPRDGSAPGAAGRARAAAGLSASELIALLWGAGSRGRSAVDLADDALARHDGLTGLARATDL